MRTRKCLDFKTRHEVVTWITENKDTLIRECRTYTELARRASDAVSMEVTEYNVRPLAKIADLALNPMASAKKYNNGKIRHQLSEVTKLLVAIAEDLSVPVPDSLKRNANWSLRSGEEDPESKGSQA